MKRFVLDPASEDGASPFRSAAHPGSSGAGGPSHRGLLRRAAERAMRAPSVHNTQPWRLVVTSAGIEVIADPGRRLDVVDPQSRQLIISCGCAVYNARVTVAAGGYLPVVTRFPDTARPDLLAVVGIGRPFPAGRAPELEAAIDRRRANRRPFAGGALPPDAVRELVACAREEHAGLLAVTAVSDRAAVLALTSSADAAERAQPAYLAELAAWTTDDLRRRDGVQAASVPHPGSPSRPAGPVRDFDTRGMGWLPEPDGAGTGDLLLIWTADDDAAAWLRAGEALEHIWLELTARGMWADPVGQPVEVARTRQQLRHLLRLRGHPQLLLRVGLAPETVPTRRRRAAEVITETDRSWTTP